MDKKTEEMIAIAVSYTLNCLPCMEYHKKQAIAAGLTNEQMQSAVAIAVMVKNGAAKKTKGYAEDLFGKITEDDSCPVDN